ncbi:MAG TPA: type II toxin-antitoxin system VapC family toxin [Edaphobacter sp.]
MVIDSSALAAIVLEEPDDSMYIAAIANDPKRLISVATLLEISIVLMRRRRDNLGVTALDALITRFRIVSVPVDQEQTLLAREAFRRFGKGRHQAGLNFGDCFSYALAKQTGEPLLYKGDDFSHTDISAA